MASTPLPMRVTKTCCGTHVVHVHSISKLLPAHCGEDGFFASPIFTVAGLDWTLRYYPDVTGNENDDDGQVGLFLELATKGAAAWAYVGLLVLNQTTGLPEPALWGEDPTLFDGAGSSTWGLTDLAMRSELPGSCYVRGDCLEIECVIDVCADRLVFPDPPEPNLDAGDPAALLGSQEGADVLVLTSMDTPPMHAHSSVLEAYAPRFFDVHEPTVMCNDEAKRVMVVVAHMWPAAVKAFLHFVYTNTLPVVAGMDGAGYRHVLRDLLPAGKRYGVPRLAAICERLLCRHLDVDSAAATLAMADRHGFEELREACVAFVLDPYNYALVRKSKGYHELYQEVPHLARELAVKYAKSYGVDIVYDEQTNLPVEVSGPMSQLHELPKKCSEVTPLPQIDSVMISDFSVKFTLNYSS